MDAKNMDERFAEAFRLARQAVGLSQADVAAQMATFGYEMSQPVVGKIERGERKVTIGEGEALSAIVNRSTRSLLEGEGTLRIELGTEHLRARRAAIADAVERYQSAQLALAQALDTLEATGDHRWTTFARNVAESLLSETPRDVIEEYEKDTRAGMAAHRMRDQLDDGAEDYDPRDLLTEERSPRLFRLQQSRGDTIDTRVSARGLVEAWGAMRGELDQHGSAPHTTE
ncbi:helix-turn-helix domain-containing protein [Microbacterium sp. HMH0099]|uniref:helix-turn-helix domain-containing protein n=1 Tax=Microbacterium sp. HMH0099 TaxID=3414026 RepID=UPI003BF6C68C